MINFLGGADRISTCPSFFSPRKTARLLWKLPTSWHGWHGVSLAFIVIVSCALPESDVGHGGTFHAEAPEAVSVLPLREPRPAQWPLLRWPDFFRVEKNGQYLWMEGGQIYRIGQSEGEPRPLSFAQGLDTLVATARASDGTLAVLDSSGRVVAYGPSSKGKSSFKAVLLQKRSRALTVTTKGIYFLLHGEERKGSAVVAYTFTGEEMGSWGTIPADAIIQSTLTGGGITSCRDESVFFSYVNSPKIFYLDDNSGVPVPIGKTRRNFKVLPEYKILRAQRESDRMSSVKPLVKLGRGASRVMSLFCSEDGLLFRQISQPRAGSYVEMIDPDSGILVHSVFAGANVLLTVFDNSMYFGVRTKGGDDFSMERIHYSFTRSQHVPGGN